MLMSILKITTFHRNVYIGKLNRQDPILLKYNYSYLIQEKLRIFYLKSQLFSEENFTIPNVLSNESFEFLKII